MNMRIFFLGLMIFLASTVWAKDELDINELKSAFRSVSEISAPESTIPNVLEVPIEFENSILDSVMIVEKDSSNLQATLVLDKHIIKKSYLTASDSVKSKNINALINGDLNDFLEYPASDSGDEQEVIINISADKDISASTLTFYLDKFVSLPKSIEVRAVVAGEEKVILGKSKVQNQTINFPKTTAREFKLSLEYIQPLRIRELSFEQENVNVSQQSSVRFLAQPNKKYQIYFNADRYVNSYGGEMPNLKDNRDVVLVKKSVVNKNEAYKKSDIDKDGVADEVDNCVNVENSNQEDINNNGRGDVCDDFDRDGIINQKDNCRDLTNRNQEDTDLDGIGNMCDEKESRVLQNQKWLPLAAIFLVAGVIGLLFFKTIKTKQ